MRGICGMLDFTKIRLYLAFGDKLSKQLKRDSNRHQIKWPTDYYPHANELTDRNEKIDKMGGLTN
jgi:hypothetical protein